MDNSWSEVSAAADRLFNILGNSRIVDATQSVYNNALPKLIDKILELAYVNDFDRSNPDIQILLEAYKQLNNKGYI